MFASKDLMFGQQSAGGYQISRSVRLRSSASAYFSRTLSTPTNSQKFTFSCWMKMGTVSIGTNEVIFDGGSTDCYFGINTSNQLYCAQGSTSYLFTTQLFRDPSSWYHLLFVVDTTQATATNRMSYYVNGVQVTSFSTDNRSSITQNGNVGINTASAHAIGRQAPASSTYFDGYLTEINFIDGQALTPTSFGAFDAVTGVWNPTRYSGTYGTNGFYLNFKDPTSTTTIGYDYSGNSNNWTANNISVTAGTTYDSMVDSPTNYGIDTGVGGSVRGSYCTGNPLWAHTSTITLSNGNLTAVWPGYWFGGTIGMSTGKWYWEFQITAGTVGSEVGIASITRQQDQGLSNSTGGNAYGYKNDGTKFVNTTFTSYGASYTTNDIVGVAFDATNATITFYKNGSSQGTAFTGITADTYLPAFGNTTGSSMTAQLNFGQRAFAYTAPTGFKALCTQNLPTPTISNGANYMAATRYTGTGSSQTVSNAVNSISFQPDLVWIKARSFGYDHKLTDSVRGATKAWISNSTSAETTDSTGLTAFGSSSFTVGANTTYNNSGTTYVGWNWKGGGTAVTNTSGTVNSSVSANTTAGFSAVTYTGSASAVTVGHGLGVAPSMVIVKALGTPNGTARGSLVYHISIGATKTLYLYDILAAATTSGPWNNTAPTSTVFSVGTEPSTNWASNNYVAYCFAAISGYSAFGSYTGNGSSDGPFVFTGLRPRWVMVKRTDADSNWQILDTSRSPYNLAGEDLLANSSDAEKTIADGYNQIDILSNGFKFRNTNCNAASGTYIYAAFAENPFTLARAR